MMVSGVSGILHVNFVRPIQPRLAGDGGKDHAESLWLRTRTDANGLSHLVLLTGIAAVHEAVKKRKILLEDQSDVE
jgi:hypothetical protein